MINTINQNEEIKSILFILRNIRINLDAINAHFGILNKILKLTNNDIPISLSKSKISFLVIHIQSLIYEISDYQDLNFFKLITNNYKKLISLSTRLVTLKGDKLTKGSKDHLSLFTKELNMIEKTICKFLIKENKES